MQLFPFLLGCCQHKGNFDPIADQIANPTANPTTDPTVDPTADPTVDSTADPTADSTADPTDPTADNKEIRKDEVTPDSPKEETKIYDVPPLFGATNNLVYFHSHTCTPDILNNAVDLCPLFEIDVAWAHTAFHDKVAVGCPFIGHPEEFYTMLGDKEYPEENVKLDTFLRFLNKHKNIKLFVDIKDEEIYTKTTVLKDLMLAVGPNRVICHAFIEAWRVQPEGTQPLAHVYRENVDIYVLDDFLSTYNVPIIANCNAYSNEHLTRSHIDKMISDTKKCNSVVSLGLYLGDNSHMPKTEFLEAFNEAGYWAWVNGNNCAMEDGSCCNPEVIEMDFDDDLPMIKDPSFNKLYNVLDRNNAWDKELRSSATTNDRRKQLLRLKIVHTQRLNMIKQNSSVELLGSRFAEENPNIWKQLRLITMSDRMDRVTRFTREDSSFAFSSNGSIASRYRSIPTDNNDKALAAQEGGMRPTGMNKGSAIWTFLNCPSLPGFDEAEEDLGEVSPTATEAGGSGEKKRASVDSYGIDLDIRQRSASSDTGPQIPNPIIQSDILWF